MTQPTIVIACTSGFGHTMLVAERVAKGAEAAGAKVILHNIDDMTDQLWADCEAADAIIFGTPTYMGNVSAKFQAFAEASSKPWFGQKWKDKIAAGFTNSGSPSGDKTVTLQSLATLAAQHGMVWVSAGMLPSSYTGDGKNHNRFGFYLGLATQSANEPASASNPAAEDQETAERFGARVAEATARWIKGK